MVVVAIMAIMAGSVSVGLSSLGDTVRVRETAGVITDIIKKIELESIRREFKKVTINFESDYLALEQESDGDSSSLTWLGMGAGSCEQGEGALHIVNPSPSDPINLAKRDEYGNNIEIQNYDAGADEDICVDFISTDDTQWVYQAFSDTENSQIIRLIHFNVRREGGATEVQITDGNNYTLEIESPYAKKTYYDSGIPATGTVTLELSGQGVTPENLTLYTP